MTYEWRLILPSCRHLARALTARTLKIRHFPDGETFLRVPPDVRGKQVLLIGASGPGADALIETVFACKTLKELGAHVTLLIPYFAYGRQDHPKDNEAHGAAAVCAAIKTTGPDMTVLINPHSARIIRWLGAHALDIMPMLVGRLPLRARAHPVIIAPDEGAARMARSVAKGMGAPVVVLHKKRLSPTRVREGTAHRSLRGTTAIIVDDLISTGNTIRAAAAQARQAGAHRVAAIVVHNVGRLNARALGLDWFIASDSLPSTNAVRCMRKAAVRNIKFPY